MFALASQLRRAAVSIPSNIAEGHGRRGRDDYRKFLGYAHGSLNEVQTQLEIALRLDYISQTSFHSLDEMTREEERILSALIRKLETSGKSL
jgi:four helix bundle protein